jgi:integrase
MDDTAKLFIAAVGDPLLSELGEATLEIFAGWLSARTWRGHAIRGTTQGKHLRHLGTILRYAGPRDSRGLKAKKTAARAGVMIVPALCSDEWPREDPGKKGSLTQEQMSQWIEAMTAATAPRIGDLSARLWLTALAVWSYNTALRIESTLAARWAWLRGSWIDIPGTCYKGKTTGHRVYVNRWALEAIRHIHTTDERIFSWRWSQNWCESCIRKSSLGPDFTMHGLRRTANTNIQAAGYERLAKIHLGQKGGDVNQQFYSHYERLAPIVLEREDVLPQPKIRPWGSSVQLFLPAVLAEPVPESKAEGEQPKELPGQKKLF